MITKKLNEIFGYGLFIIGALKIILLILILLQVGTNMTAALNGGSGNLEDYSIISTTIGFAQLILAIGSIIMIILNIKEQPGVIIGYLLGLGAILIEFIIPSIFAVYAIFVESGMYMKAGMKIRNQNTGGNINYRKIKKDMKNTEWFYGDSDK